MLHATATEHLHYHYTFTPALCRRRVEKSTSVSCQSSKEVDLISGGKNFCTN